LVEPDDVTSNPVIQLVRVRDAGSDALAVAADTCPEDATTGIAVFG
jgi:hypothetical protein